MLFPMMQSPIARGVLGLLVASQLCIIGCGGGGPPTAEVVGKVIYKGKPLPVGQITFHSEVGSKSASIYEGNYTAVGVFVGANKITIESMGAPASGKGGRGTGFTGGQAKAITTPPLKAMLPPDKIADMEAKKDQPKIQKLPIPPRYKNPDMSQLTRTIEKGKNTYDVELTD